VGETVPSPKAGLQSLNTRTLTRIRLDPRLKMLVVVLVILVFSIQALRVLLQAYPVMSKGVYPGNNFTLDFGVYYTSGWRLIHQPSQLYAAAGPGNFPLSIRPPEFKYLPFFSFFMLPFLALDYIPSLVTWNVFQFLLMPLMGLLLYKALKSVNLLVIVGVLWIVLLQPLPFPPHYTISFYDLYTSQSYYWQWAEGQAKVFMTFLIVAAYYLSKSRRPYLAGLTYGLAFFDPRFPLYALPLFLMVNWGQYRRFAAAAIGTLVVGDVILLYDGLAASFLSMVETSGIGTVFFQYSWIPFYSIAAITAVEAIILVRKVWSGRAHRVGEGQRGVSSLTGGNAPTQMRIPEGNVEHLAS
jgi:hypothetical protein